MASFPSIPLLGQNLSEEAREFIAKPKAVHDFSFEKLLAISKELQGFSWHSSLEQLKVKLADKITEKNLLQCFQEAKTNSIVSGVLQHLFTHTKKQFNADEAILYLMENQQKEDLELWLSNVILNSSSWKKIFQNNPQLKMITLQNCKIDEELIHLIVKNFPELRFLFLDSEFEGYSSCISSICSLKKLEILSISAHLTVEEILILVKNLPNLDALLLSECKQLSLDQLNLFPSTIEFSFKVSGETYFLHQSPEKLVSNCGRNPAEEKMYFCGIDFSQLQPVQFKKLCSSFKKLEFHNCILPTKPSNHSSKDEQPPTGLKN